MTNKVRRPVEGDLVELLYRICLYNVNKLFNKFKQFDYELKGEGADWVLQQSRIKKESVKPMRLFHISANLLKL